MINHQTENNNRFDQGLSLFFQQYRYEILASLVLVALVLGGVAASIYFNQGPEENIVVETDRESQENLEGDESNQATLWVDIAGSVNFPDLYEIRASSRLKDLIDEAGGLSEEADLDWVAKNLNMAQVLQDGQKVYIPSKKTSSFSGGSETRDSVVGTKININTASKSALMSLPGIGEKYAERIIQGRPFQRIEDLLKISGIGDKRFEDIQNKVSVF